MAGLTRVKDWLVTVKSKIAGAVERLLEDRLSDTISIKDFGAKGDGVTDDTAAIQAAINACKGKRALRAPSGRYVVTQPLVADYALVLIGEGGNGFNGTNTSHNPSPHIGTTFISKVTSGYTLSVAPDKFTFGLTLRDFCIEADESIQDSTAGGLYLEHIGWTGVVDGINIEGFKGSGLGIGYIQDTHFNNLTVLRCGNKDIPSIDILKDSNYVYFDNCHIEMSSFLFRNKTAWEVYFSNTHFEIAEYTDPNLPRIDYKQAPIQLGTGETICFSTCTFVPCSDQFLSSKLGVPLDSTPYFITGAGTHTQFKDCKWIAPTGSISAVRIDGYATQMSGCFVKSMTPSRPSVWFKYAQVSNNEFSINTSADQQRLYGIWIDETGSFTNNYIGSSDVVTGGRRTEGILVGSTQNTYSVKVGGNTYTLGTEVANRFVSQNCQIDGSDGGTEHFVGIQDTTFSIDLEKYPPNVHFGIWSSSWTLGDVTGIPTGRTVMFHAGASDGTINQGEHIKNQGHGHLSVTNGDTIMYRGLSDGVRRLFQVK